MTNDFWPHRFRKKPVIIQAFQMSKSNRALIGRWPSWLVDAWGKPPQIPGSVNVENDSLKTDFDAKLTIHTLEGDMLVDWDDWIIMGVQGELYPCKPDIFNATYDYVVGCDICEGVHTDRGCSCEH